MKRLRSILGNTGAVLTVGVAAIAPFLLFGWFQNAVAAMHLRIDPVYSGGERSHVIERGTYRIVVNRPVPRRSPLGRAGPFVQMAWMPADRLPAQVSDEVDVDGDGTPDLLVSFDSRRLELTVTPHDGRYRAVHARGVNSFGELIARVNDRVVVRVPGK